MFVFGVPEGENLIRWHLHCGDFRASSSILNQKLNYLDREVQLKFTDFLFDSVYLDTTYANPKHCFPPQEQVIAACVNGCSRLMHGQYDPAGQKRLIPLKWMVAVGSYLIGKERIVLALAETFDLLIYADARKRSILRLLKWPELEDRLTDDPLATPLHFVSMALLSKQKLSDYRDSFKGRFSHVLGIKPTGWSFDDKTEATNSKEWNLALPKIEGTAGVWPVPYSEHSSYKELEEFLKAISVHRVIPTVDNYADIVLDTRRVGGNTSALLQQWARRNK
jgi:DNA cross-link repair 1A protein